MSLNSLDVALIAERFDLFITQGDADALRPSDLLALLDEVRILSRQHEHDVKMITRCREQLSEVCDAYREANAHLQALTAQGAAEEGEPEVELAEDL